MGRAPCCDKANVKKGPWSPEEDAKLKSYIEKHGTGGNWIALPEKIGLKRCGKSCRLRWLNYLRPNIKHGGFSEEEDNIISSLYISIGSRWSIIAAQLPGRTDNDIKNYWNTRLKKKLLGKQRKDKQSHTHRENQRGSFVSDSLIYQKQPVTYESQMPLLLQPVPLSNEEPWFKDHVSIRKLLIKLGGKFSNQSDDEMIKLENPINQDPWAEKVYHPSIDLISPTSRTSPPIASQFDMSSTMLEGLSFSFDAQLQNENPQKLQGLEFLYDDILNNTSSSYEGSIMDWGGMNSLVFPASDSNNCEGLLQRIVSS